MAAHLDHGNTAGQLGHALLHLFAVVVAGRFFDLHADLLHASFDVSSAGAVDDGGVFFAHFNALILAQVSQGDLVQSQADFFSDDLAASQDGDNLPAWPATVAEAQEPSQPPPSGCRGWCSQPKGSQGFAIDFFSDDQQRTTRLGNLLQGRQQVTDVGDLLVAQQHEGVVQQSGLLSLGC